MEKEIRWFLKLYSATEKYWLQVINTSLCRDTALSILLLQLHVCEDKYALFELTVMFGAMLLHRIQIYL